MRAEARAQRRQTYLDAAVVIVLRDGFEGLTMNAIAREVDAAVGTIYGYFRSKSALIAELQVFAIQRLISSWDEANRRWDAAFADAGLDARERSLAAIMALGEFFVDLEAAYPEEFRLQQMQLLQQGEMFDAEDFSKLVPVATELIGAPLSLIERAVVTGVIDRGVGADASMDRAVLVALSIDGLALINNVQGLQSVLSVKGLTRRLVADLLVGWGASREVVERVQPVVFRVIADDPITAHDSYRDAKHLDSEVIDLHGEAGASVEGDGGEVIEVGDLSTRTLGGLNERSSVG